jgi:hypothetical protein
MMIRKFRLTNEQGGLGLSCSPAGLALAGVPLLHETAAGFEPRPASEIATLLKAAYGANGGPILLQSRLEAIAQALDNKDFGLAAIAAVQMRIPELNSESAARVAHAEEKLSKYNYNPSEPRDWHGRWTRNGSAGPVSVAALGIESEQRVDSRAYGRPQRFADNASSDAAAPSDGADGDRAQAPKSREKAFERKYDDLGPVDFAKEVIRFGDWLGREGKDLSSAEKDDAFAEYSFLHNRVLLRLAQDYESMTVQGNLHSAALTLYQGAVNAGLVRPGHGPDPLLVEAATSPVASGDGPPGRAYRMPRLKDAPAAVAQVPKEVEQPGRLGETDKPVKMTLSGVEHTMPDWHMEVISYTKRADAEVDKLRDQFDRVRKAFMKDLAENDTAELRDAGVSDEDIASMANGRVPKDYEVHHKLPLDDGGTNALSNLMLIKTDPDHYLITVYQKQRTRGMSAGETWELEWPMPDSRVSIWPKTPDGGAYPAVHKLEWPMSGPQVRIWPKTLDGAGYPTVHKAGEQTMSDIDELLANIYAEKRAEMIEPPASPKEIERLRRLVWDTLRTNLPEGYVTFLGKTDGLVFNGYMIYGSTERRKPYFLSGFVEANEIFGEADDRYVYYGQSSIDIYAQDRTSGAWVTLDRPSWDVVATFPSFDAMLAHVLREAVE